MYLLTCHNHRDKGQHTTGMTVLVEEEDVRGCGIEGDDRDEIWDGNGLVNFFISPHSPAGPLQNASLFVGRVGLAAGGTSVLSRSPAPGHLDPVATRSGFLPYAQDGALRRPLCACKYFLLSLELQAAKDTKTNGDGRSV